MWWYIDKYKLGHFDEVQMRLNKDGSVLVADRAVLRTAYSNASDIPWYIMQSIALIPPPPPTATSTPEPATTETPEPAGVLTPAP
jgi:hypothetical protein